MIALCALCSSLAAGGVGCAAAAVGAAGAAGVAGGVAYTDRGAKGQVKGDVLAVREHARSALRDLGVHVSGSEMKNSGQQQSLTGKSGKEDVTVQMSALGSGVTQVEVTAKSGTLSWDKDYAKEILRKIIARS